MTDAELKAIEERATHENLSPGPWTVEWANVTSGDVVGPVDPGPNWGGRAQYSRWDAEFIAHARSDVPALLAEVRRLQAEIGPMRELLEVALDATIRHGAFIPSEDALRHVLGRPPRRVTPTR